MPREPSASQSASTKREACPVCGESYLGLNRHITVKHPDYRQAHPLHTRSRQTTKAATALLSSGTTLTPPSDPSHLDSEDAVSNMNACSHSVSVIPDVADLAGGNDIAGNSESSSTSNGLIGHEYEAAPPRNTKKPATKCDLCGHSITNIELHYRISHPRVATRRLQERLPGIDPLHPIEDKSGDALHEVRSNLAASFIPQLTAIQNALADSDSTDKKQLWAKFEAVYEAFVRKLLELQPKFYNAKNKKNKKLRKRRAELEISKARKDFLWLESQYLFHEEPKKLRRRVFGSDADDSIFSAEQLKNYYSSVYQHVNNKTVSAEYMPPTNPELAADVSAVIEPLLRGITACAVLKAMSGMSHEAAAGGDRLRLKTIRTYDNEGKILAAIFTLVVSFGRIPTAWKSGRTVIIPKPGKNPDDLDNRRPITMVSIVRRIYCRIINACLLPHTKLHISQKGFQKGPGLILNTHLVREILAHSKRKHRRLYMVFFDVKKAFDSVGHAHVLLAMRLMGVPQSIIDAVKALYEGFSTQVVHKNITSSPIPICSGVLQGCPMSPTLFNIAINYLLEYLHTNLIECGYDVDGADRILAAMFADDLTVFASSCDEAILICQTVGKLLDDIGLQLNANKCCGIVVGDDVDEGSRFYAETFVRPLGADEIFRYLGTEISANSGPAFDTLGARVGKDCDRIIEYEYLRLYQRLYFFNTNVLSKLVYPAQVHCLGLVSAADNRTLSDYALFDEICKAVWRKQLEIVDLFVQTPRNYIRGEAQRRCLGLADPHWILAANGATTARMLQLAADSRIQALNSSNAVDFAAVIRRHAANAVKDLTKYCMMDDLTEIITDDKLLKCRRFLCRLRKAAADGWRDSMSGLQAGATLSDQMLEANCWQKTYRGMADGVIHTALKLNGNQHCLRNKRFLWAGRGHTAATGGDKCRLCGADTETPGHLLGGSCQATKKLVMARHDAVQKVICDAIVRPKAGRISDWRVTQNPVFPRTFEHNKPDVLVESADGTTCYLLDPTVRFESTDKYAADAVLDKLSKYEPLVGYLKSTRGFIHVQIQGLFFGARGILLRSTIDFLTKTFGIDAEKLLPISRIIMEFTTSIYNKVICGHLSGVTTSPTST